MNTLEELLGIDPDSPSMRRATQLVENDRALLRRLTQLRGDQGLTQQDVADRMGVTQPTVARFEAYDSNPTLASIRRYAHAVGALVTHVVETDSEQRQDGGSWIPVRMSTKLVSTPSQNNHTEHVPPSRLQVLSGVA